MAEFAFVACHDVAYVLAFRRRAVMATESIRRDRIVIETRIFPSAGSMTVAARVGTRDVPHRLGRSHQPYVTAFAVLSDGPMIHSRGFPEASRMAVVAICLNRYVAGRATRLGPIAHSAVTQITLEWRSYELPVDVAALAGNTLVFPCERKPRKIMVEGRRRLCRRNRGQQQTGNARKQQPGKTLTTFRHGPPEFRTKDLIGFDRLDSGDHFNPLLRPNVAGFQASSVWQSSQLRPNPPRCASSAA